MLHKAGEPVGCEGATERIYDDEMVVLMDFSIAETIGRNSHHWVQHIPCAVHVLDHPLHQQAANQSDISMLSNAVIVAKDASMLVTPHAKTTV